MKSYSSKIRWKQDVITFLGENNLMFSLHNIVFDTYLFLHGNTSTSPSGIDASGHYFWVQSEVRILWRILALGR